MSPADLDFALALWVVTHLRAAWLDPVMVSVTNLNKNPVFWAAGAAAFAAVFYRSPRAGRPALVLRLALFAAAVGITDFISSGVVKPSVGRLRPFIAHPESISHLVGGGPLSFPSGHAANSFAAATFLFLATRSGRIAAVVFPSAALAAFSRVYVGLHYPGDVAAGACLGAAVAAAIWRLRRPIERRFPALAPGGGAAGASGETAASP